jgi:membrane protein YqaA with SNARE-associated domain
LLEKILPAIQEFFNGIIHSAVFIKYGLAGLFANGVLSATILPIGSPKRPLNIPRLLSSGNAPNLGADEADESIFLSSCSHSLRIVSAYSLTRSRNNFLTSFHRRSSRHWMMR